MIVLNETGNTIYVQDLDMHIPHNPDEEVVLDAETLKSSRSLRSFIINGMLTIKSFNKDEKVENSIMYMRSKNTEINEFPKRPNHTSVDVMPDPEPIENCVYDIEVKIHGMFYDAGGYSKVNRNLALSLSNAGVKVKASPKRSQNQLQEDELRPIKELEKNQISRNHILIDSIVPSFADISSGRYKILYTTIESYTIPKQFVECCQLYDEIWLTSEWSADILRKFVDKPIYCVQTGVDHGLYSEYGSKFDLKPSINDFVFVSVFGWSYRKGYDALLKAYFDEFDRDDNVSLLIASRYQSGTTKFHRNKIKSDIDAIMEKFPNKDLPHVVRYSQIIPEQDMPKLYRAANAFVLSTRGEGGGLPPLEASLCGLPVIMTNCSGQQGYLKKDNSYPLDIDQIVEMQTGQMHIHYWDGQKFPSLTSTKFHDNLKKTLRHVYENYNEAKNKNKKLQQLILEKFTWNTTTNLALERLKAISEKIRKSQ